MPLRGLDRGSAPLLLIIREVASSQARPRQQARLSLLGRLAGPLSHEIRNPMNAIFLHIDIVEEEVHQLTPDDGAQVTQSLATIKAEVARLHALIQDYLYLARLSELQRAPVDLRALVEDVSAELQSQRQNRGVRVVLSGLDTLGQVALHQSLFRRALLNILRPLVEAMPQNTTLSLSAERTDCRVQLQIGDHARVIPPEVWAALQTPLHNMASETADLQKFVAQEIIAAHGGSLQIRDTAEAGVSCTIALPVGTTAEHPLSMS
jgi:signal transduction histidine kinase